MGLALHALAVGAASIGGLMLVLWVVHLPLRNAAIVDVGWAAGMALLGPIYAGVARGGSGRAWIMAAMALVWGVRLAVYLLITRVVGHEEEGRYRQLRRSWGRHVAAKFLVFFEVQALLCVLLSAPFLLAALDARPGLSLVEYAAIAVWLVAFAGECTADFQLRGFKAREGHRGQTCRVGLWRYSRHPNYFFEWLVWVAFALFALPSPHGFWALGAPALMLFFLLRVTGIPATEAQALRTRGDDYRQYQRTTSAFVPWWPRG